MMNSMVRNLLSMTALVALLGACADDGEDQDAGASDDRPEVTVVLRDGSMDIPDRIPGGLVDIILQAEEGSVEHHVAFFRLADGVSYEEFLDPPDGDDTGLMTFQGGNGTLPPGETARLTLDLPPGTYAVRDMGEEDNASAEVVVDGESSRREPAADGTITFGPGMVFNVPDAFSVDGTWRFTNADPDEPHEATLVRLQPDRTIEDLVEWANTFEGPPPADFVGGFGALGPGISGWMHFTDELEDGTYAFACFIPSDDGALHVAQGMVAPISR